MQQRESLNKAILAMHPCRHYMVQVEVQVVTLSDQISTRSKFRGGLWQTLRAHGNKPWMSSSHYAYVQFTESKRQSISRRACAGSLILASAVSLRRARAGPTRRSVRPVATGFGYQPRPPFVMIIVIGLARPWARTFERPLAGATRRLSCGIIYCSVVACYIEISPKNFEISCSCDWTRPVFAAVRGPITTGGKGKTKSQTSDNVRGYSNASCATALYSFHLRSGSLPEPWLATNRTKCNVHWKPKSTTSRFHSYFQHSARFCQPCDSFTKLALDPTRSHGLF